MAFGSVSDILLRITGDPDDAAHAIEEVAADLAIFSKTEAEAKVKVDTEKAKADLALMKERLDAISTDDAEPQVKVKIAEALVEIGVIQAELDRLDGENVNVDVDVQRGAFERLNALSNSMFGLTKKVRTLEGDATSLGAKLSDVGFIAGPFAARIGTIGPILAALSPIIVSLAGAVVALAGSLTSAVLGLGALAVAFGGVLTAGIGLAFAAIARFKQQADTAGTPANALKNAFNGISDAAKKLLPAVDPVLKALASGLTALKPLIAFLAPAFKQFGQFAAQAVQQFVGALSSPAIALGISNLLKLAGPALTPLANIAAQLFRIFLNIAQAALPALNAALSVAAGWFQKIGDSTSNISGLRSTINGLVGVLGSWLQLLGAVGDALFSILSASSGPGTELVQWLTKGAQALADWASSAKGQDAIKSFFEDTLPLVKQLVTLVGQLVVIFIQVGQIMAPVLAPVAAALNLVLGYVRQLLSAFLSLPAPVRTAIVAVLAIIVALLTGVGEVTAAVLIVVGVIALLSVAFNAVKSAAVAAFNFIIGVLGSIAGVARAAWQGITAAARSVWGVVRGIFNDAIAAIKARLLAPVAAFRWIISAAKSVASTVRSIISGLASAVGGLVSRAAGSAWHWIADAARNVAATVRSVISSVVDWIKDRINDAINVVHRITDAINAAKDAVNGLLGSIDSAIDKAGDLVDKISSLPGKALSLLASGTRNWPGGMAIVGERGPELVNLPRGSDVFSNPETKNIMESLSKPDVASVLGTITPVIPALAVPGGGGGGHTSIYNIEAPAGELPDAESTVALIDMKSRARGQR